MTDLRNRWPWIVAGVLAIGAVVAGGAVVLSGGDEEMTAALRLTRDVPSGAQLQVEDLEVVEVDADLAAELVDAAQLDAVVGQYADQDLVAHSLLRPNHLRRDPRPPAGMEWVPLSVTADEVPDGIVAGAAARVDVTLAPTCDNPQPSSELIDVTVIEVPDDLEAQRAAPDAAQRSVRITVEVDTVHWQQLAIAADPEIVPRGKTLPTTTQPAPVSSLDCSLPAPDADSGGQTTTSPPAPVVNLDAGEFLVTTTTTA